MSAERDLPASSSTGAWPCPCVYALVLSCGHCKLCIGLGLCYCCMCIHVHTCAYVRMCTHVHAGSPAYVPGSKTKCSAAGWGNRANSGMGGAGSDGLPVGMDCGSDGCVLGTAGVSSGARNSEGGRGGGDAEGLAIVGLVGWEAVTSRAGVRRGAGEQGQDSAGHWGFCTALVTRKNDLPWTHTLMSCDARTT